MTATTPDFSTHQNRLSERLSFDEARAILRRRRAVLLLPAVAASLAAVLWAVFWPPTFESRVRFLVREPIPVDSSGTERSADATDVHTEMAILTSTTVFEETSQRLGFSALRRARFHELLESARRLVTELPAYWTGTPAESPGARAARHLQAALRVSRIPDSQVIEARLLWHDPTRGRTILEEISTSYFRARLAVRRVTPTSSLLFEQVQAREAELHTVEDEIRRIRSDASLESARFQRDLLMRQASEFAAELHRTTALRREAEARFRQQTEELLKEESGSSAADLRRNAIADRVNGAGIRERIDAYRSALADYEAQVDELELENFQLGRFERKRRAAEESYFEALNRFDSARQGEALEGARLVDVVMIEPVRARAMAVGPPVAWVLLGLPLLGLALGLVLLLVMESLDRRIYTSLDCERQLGLRPLAEVPDARATGRI